jgi:hypothetical protein
MTTLRRLGAALRRLRPWRRRTPPTTFARALAFHMAAATSNRSALDA